MKVRVVDVVFVIAIRKDVRVYGLLSVCLHVVVERLAQFDDV